jgi:hypothetical protein
MGRAHPTPAGGGGSRLQFADAVARDACPGRCDSVRRGARVRIARAVRRHCCCRVTARKTLRVPQSPIALVTEVARTTGTAGMEPDGIHADIPVLRCQA